MIKHTFLKKCCTIVKGSNINTGNSPVGELNYGNNVSRMLIDFDIDEIKSVIRENKFDETNVKHILKMTNCASINNDMHNDRLLSGDGSFKQRASSFDIILFTLPEEWDKGIGYEYVEDFWIGGNKGVSTQGCNWFYRKNGIKWPERGIYDVNILNTEYDKFKEGEESIIIGEQHFEVGNEDMSIDITKYINSVDSTNGIGIAFSPLYEEIEGENKYVGFFSNCTNTFFHPYIETIIKEDIYDDRFNFRTGRKNKLYFMPKIDNEPIVSDNVSCTIEGLDENKEVEVRQVRKGLYCAEFTIKNDDITNDTILYDKWLISPKNEQYEPIEVEQSFAVFKGNNVNIDCTNNMNVVPVISTYSNNEIFKKGDIIDIDVTFKKKYEFYKEIIPPRKSYYRIYSKNAGKEITIFDYQPIDILENKGMISLDTSNFSCGNYIMDIKIDNNREKNFRNIFEFQVSNDETSKFI